MRSTIYAHVIGGIMVPFKPTGFSGQLFYRHAATVDGLLAGLSADGLGAAPGGRGAVYAALAGASRSAGSTVRLERAWCPPRALSRLACDFLTWQAVVAVGVEVHLWQLEVQLRRPLLVRACPRPASPRVAPHRLWPATCRRRLLRCWLLQITHAALRSTCDCTDPRGRPAPPP